MEEIVIAGEEESIRQSLVGGPLKMLKKGAKKVGRGAKKVGKGVGKVAKKTGKAVTSPLGLTILATAATGGAGLLVAKTVAEARKGNPNALRALSFLKTKAKAGDPNARKALTGKGQPAFTSVNRGVYRPTRYIEGVRG